MLYFLYKYITFFMFSNTFFEELIHNDMEPNITEDYLNIRK